jgi:membrane associated rhomboid family serine protease
MIKIIEVTVDVNFSHFDVYPSTFEGLAGILFDPLIHDSWSHLASNTMPLIVFGTALLYGYPKAAKLTLPRLYLDPEIGVWLFARHSFHFGASGLTFGMIFFTLGAIR